MYIDAVNIVNGAGFIDDVIALVILIGVIALVLAGIIPALYRLGNGLSRKKIAIFAKPQAYGELRQLLLESGLFWSRNIIPAHSPNAIDSASKANVFLVFWPDWAESIDVMMSRRKPSAPVVVYAPDGPKSIPAPILKELDNHRHTSVTNFRGRLLNDLVTSMITSSYEK